MTKVCVVLLAGILAVPMTASAQRYKAPQHRRQDTDCCYFNRFSLEPYVGAVKDAYDVSPDGSDTSYLLGAKIGYLLNGRTRLMVNFGYSESDNVSNPAGLGSYYTYDNNWVFTTGGGEFDVVPGRTSASIGMQLGVGWRKNEVDDVVGNPLSPPFQENWKSVEVAIPSLAMRHRLSGRATFAVALQDHITSWLEGSAEHSPALTVGMSFR